jgi:hypothetical protein
VLGFSPHSLDLAASPTVGATSFGHKVWELACDNTRTRHAAGYADEDDGPHATILLTRVAGPNRPGYWVVDGSVARGVYQRTSASRVDCST